MPEIPPDWRPRPARVWGTTRKWDEGPGAKKETKEVIRGQQGRPLTFEQVCRLCRDHLRDRC
jgi:G patch domain-containing protein 1